MAFGKPKKRPIGIGEPRSEAERQKVNKALKTDYGIEDAFKKPVDVRTRRTKTVQKAMGEAASGIKTDEEKRGK
jgi:hypothetical protein